jgi:hypothetical protein
MPTSCQDFCKLGLSSALCRNPESFRPLRYDPRALPLALCFLIVSQKLREEYENGRDYYALHGKRLAQPENALAIPSLESLNYHAESVFRG